MTRAMTNPAEEKRRRLKQRNWALLAALVGFFHYVTHGPNEVQDEDEEAAARARRTSAE